jgi:NAD(P)-dependent dehydrogenase (short-subunit alcohol dehydrogenase family)
MGDLLAGRVALVSGGARGLGRAIVQQFSEQGARGLVLDQESVIQISRLPTSFDAIAADVSRKQDLLAAFATVASTFNKLDIVVANAGIVPRWRETAELDLDEWDHVFAVNVRGVAATIKHAVPLMKTSGGSIVVTASINATRAAARQMTYSASKHAVLGIVKSAALDLGRYGIRVNALAPGPVMTQALRERIRYRMTLGGPSEAQAERELAAQTPLNRLATEDEVGKVAVFLASDLSSAMSGQMLPIDSGYTAT